jgi:TRAP-type C4-dicarboxylate transport system permease small subunit
MAEPTTQSEKKEEHPPAHPEPGVVRGLRVIDKAFGLVEAAIVAVFLATLIGVGAYQAISRNFFNSNPDWVDPIIRSSVFLIGMVGAAMAAQSDRMINIDILSRFFPLRAKIAVRIITTLIAVYVCWYLIKAGLIVRGTMVGERDENIIKAEWVALALPVFTSAIAFHMVLHSVIDAYYLVVGRKPPETEGLRL